MNKNLKELLMSVDILNTLLGGVSEPFLSLRENPTEREVRVRVPGMEANALKAEVNNNELSIYYMIPVNSLGTVINMPKVIYSIVLPHFIEVPGIHAEYDENNLVVHLPFNELHNGYHKKITTE